MNHSEPPGPQLHVINLVGRLTANPELRSTEPTAVQAAA